MAQWNTEQCRTTLAMVPRTLGAHIQDSEVIGSEHRA